MIKLLTVTNNDLKKDEIVENKIPTKKVCGSCNKLYLFVPLKAKRDPLGYWWNCSCKSTLLVTESNIDNKAA